MRCPSRIRGCRRELNSPNAAKPQDGNRSSLLRPQPLASAQDSIKASLCHLLDLRVWTPSRCGRSAAKRLGAAVPNQTSDLRRRPWTSISSPGRRCPQCVPRPKCARRLKHAASCVQQRGAGSFGSRLGQVTGSWQAQHLRLCRPVQPNPSLKRSANGRPPGPGRWYAVHFHQPGPGVPPSVPA